MPPGALSSPPPPLALWRPTTGRKAGAAGPVLPATRSAPDMNASDAERQDLLPGSLSAAGGSSAPPPGGGDCLLHICRVFNFLTSVCALLCALAFGMSMWVRGDATVKVRRPAKRSSSGQEAQQRSGSRAWHRRASFLRVNLQVAAPAAKP